MTEMRLSGEMKHILHALCFIMLLLWFEYSAYSCILWFPSADEMVPVKLYGSFGSAMLYLLHFVSLLSLPSRVCSMMGLILLNAFRDKVPLKQPPQLAPYICIRVVTRGEYRELVRTTLAANIKTCLKVGMEKFIVEVVTGKALNLEKSLHFREIVVPDTYISKSGAMFKARKLQYCLEDDVNKLQDDDWVVHLDEETLLTEDSVRGILNFCIDGKHPFGQGVVTYANGHIVNWVTTFADSYRVADNFGKRRFQLQCLNRPFFGWNGSFMVMQLGIERKVTFDHGPDGSIAEDCYFSTIAYRDGYTFNFIEGEMHEQSTYTIYDFMQQRKRWFHGVFLVLYSSNIPWGTKTLLAISYMEWATGPLNTLNYFVSPLFPLPCHPFLQMTFAFISAVAVYTHVFGIFKSFSHRYQDKPCRLLFFMCGALFTIPLTICLENMAVLYAMWCGMFQSHVHQFYVVNK